MPLKTIIFDWDGVLNNSANAMYRSYLAVLEEFKLPKIRFSGFRKLWESDYRKFEEKIGITKNKRNISDKVWFNAYTKQKEEINLFPGARDFLFKVKKEYKIGLVTVGDWKRIKNEINRYELKNIFNAIVTSEDTKRLKPDPEALNICVKRLKVDPKNCAYVGDSKGDILAARNASMIPIAVTWGYHDIPTLESVKPNYIAHNFNELYEILKNF